MEAGFKSTQRFVPPLVGIFLQKATIGHFALTVEFSTISTCISNSTNVCLCPIALTTTFVQIQIFKKIVQPVILL